MLTYALRRQSECHRIQDRTHHLLYTCFNETGKFLTYNKKNECKLAEPEKFMYTIESKAKPTLMASGIMLVRGIQDLHPSVKGSIRFG